MVYNFGSYPFFMVLFDGLRCIRFVKTKKMYQQRQLTQQLLIEENRAEKFGYLLEEKDELIVDFLLATHWRIINEIVPRIEQDFMSLSTKIEDKNRFPILFSLFQRFYISLSNHMKLEEENIFPILTNQNFEINKSVLNHVQHFSHEDEEPYLLEIIQALERVNANNNPFIEILIKKLKYFQLELQDHSWVEENILKERILKKVIAKQF